MGSCILGHVLTEIVIDAFELEVTPEFALAMNGYSLVKLAVQLYQYYECRATHVAFQKGILLTQCRQLCQNLTQTHLDQTK